MVTKIVPFRVVFATSEDDDEHEANELLAPGPDTRGWASDAYCIYPQVISLSNKLLGTLKSLISDRLAFHDLKCRYFQRA